VEGLHPPNLKASGNAALLMPPVRLWDESPDHHCVATLQATESRMVHGPLLPSQGARGSCTTYSVVPAPRALVSACLGEMESCLPAVGGGTDLNRRANHDDPPLDPRPGTDPQGRDGQ